MSVMVDMTDRQHLVQDLLAHAHEAPAVAAALMRRAARELRQAEPDCGLCGDSGQMVVGETRGGGVLVTSCTCQEEQTDAQR